MNNNKQEIAFGEPEPEQTTLDNKQIIQERIIQNLHNMHMKKEEQNIKAGDQVLEMRDKLFNKALLITKYILIVSGVILIINGICCFLYNKLFLSDTVLIALLGASIGNIFGLLVIVTKFLFKAQ